MSMPAAILAADITVGDHPTWHFLGLTFNVDTMYTTVIAAVLTVGFLWFVARRASAEVPNKIQVITETVINQARNYIEDAVGHDVPNWLVPLGVSLFFFILFCNWLAWIPSGHSPERLAPPTADVNTVYAMTLVVVVLYTYLGIKRKGARYAGDWFTVKPAIRRPILILEQVVNPLSLSLRLFGNIFAGGIMLAVIALLPFYLFPLYGIADFGWRLFDSGLIAPIQAFIYSFLTILYFGFATAEEH
ncbi:MAG: F0F1 ATP synthase subunit A [Frankiaceae bacterium]|nr:F0F1 ATP synthase subunit A [Frankiaceae bacterium]MBV9369378.1 F0F1 ATP synthase subunit A [Frankiales bacterium]